MEEIEGGRFSGQGLGKRPRTSTRCPCRVPNAKRPKNTPEELEEQAAQERIAAWTRRLDKERRAEKRVIKSAMARPLFWLWTVYVHCVPFGFGSLGSWRKERDLQEQARIYRKKYRW